MALLCIGDQRCETENWVLKERKTTTGWCGTIFSTDAARPDIRNKTITAAYAHKPPDKRTKDSIQNDFVLFFVGVAGHLTLKNCWLSIVILKAFSRVLLFGDVEVCPHTKKGEICANNTENKIKLQKAKYGGW